MDYDKCEGCPIDGQFEPYLPNYTPDARFLVVTDPVTETAIRRDVLMPPAQSKLFEEVMGAEQFQPDEFTYHPSCLCPYNPDMHTNREKTAIHKHCRVHLQDAIEELEPELVVPLGGVATSAVAGRNVKIMSVKGLGQNMDGIAPTVIPILHPGQVIRYPENRPFLESDAAAFGRLVDANGDREKAGEVDVGELIEVDDLEFLIDMDPEDIAFDMETTSLRWYQKGYDVRSYEPDKHRGATFFTPRAQILCMTFTVKEGQAYILPWDMPGHSIPEHLKPKLRNQLRKLLCKEDRFVFGHNLLFDTVYLWMVEGIRVRIGGDSLVLMSLHDENAMNKDLASLTKIFAPELAGYSDWFDRKYNKGRMWEVEWEDMKPYAGGDTIAAWQVYNKLEDLVAADEGNWNYYTNVSIPGTNSFAGLESRGLVIDLDHLAEFREFMREMVTDLNSRLLAQVPSIIKRQTLATYSGPADKALSFTRADFVRDILFTNKNGFRLTPKVYTKTTERLPDHMRIPSTSSKDHLPYFFEECPFTELLAEYVRMNDLLTKNIEGYETKYIVDGMVRPKYSLTKTKTRRSNSYDPNGQNGVKRGEMATRYQRSHKAPDGWVIITCDYSQLEIRVAAEMSGDPVLIRIYREAKDVHIATACIALGITEEAFKRLPPGEQKEWRTKAKAINFGFLYGMSWRKFASYAKTQYGADFTDAESKAIRTAFFTKYKGLVAYHERQRKLVRKYKYVRSLTGLVRHLPSIDSPEEGIQAEAERQAINSPVQETGSTLGVLALTRMEHEIDSEVMPIVGFIHDALYAAVRPEHVEWGMKTMRDYMQSNDLEGLFGWKPKVPIVADCGFGPTMGDIFEVSGLGTVDEWYDWENSDILKDKEGRVLYDMVAQEIPANGGRLERTIYTTPDDLEPEDVPPTRSAGRVRRVGTAVETPVKRRVRVTVEGN